MLDIGEPKRKPKSSLRAPNWQPEGANQGAPSSLQGGSLEGTFVLNGVTLPPSHRPCLPPGALLKAKMPLVLLRTRNINKNWQENQHIQVASSAAHHESKHRLAYIKEQQGGRLKLTTVAPVANRSLTTLPDLLD